MSRYDVTSRVRKLAKPWAVLAVAGLLGQALMPWCIGSAVASVSPASTVLAAGEHPDQTGDFRLSTSHHCCPQNVDFEAPPSRGVDCCDWAGVSPFSGNTPARGMLLPPDLKAVLSTPGVFTPPRSGLLQEPLPADPPLFYTRPLYLFDCAFLE